MGAEKKTEDREEKEGIKKKNSGEFTARSASRQIVPHERVVRPSRALVQERVMAFGRRRSWLWNRTCHAKAWTRYIWIQRPSWHPPKWGWYRLIIWMKGGL